MRAGMLSRERALHHRREEGQDVDLERHQASAAGGVPDPGPAGRRRGPGLAHRARALRRLGGTLRLRLLLRAAVARADVVLVVDGPRVQVQQVHVHDHLAPVRREVGHDALDARDVDLAAGPADDEHLGPAGPVDLDDRAQLLAGRGADGEALQLVEEPAARARGPRRGRRSPGRRPGARPRPRAWATSRKRSHQPGPSATARRPRRWSGVRVRPFEVEGRAHAEALLRAVREELDADVAVQPAETADERDDQPRRGGAGRGGIRAAPERARRRVGARRGAWEPAPAP